MKILNTMLLAILIFVGLPSIGHAQDNSILKDEYITTQEFVKAKVLRIKLRERILVVKGANRGHVREFIVPDDTYITVRGQKAKLHDLRRGDEVEITMTPVTEHIVITRLKVPDTNITLAARMAEPNVEKLPDVLPQTASNWYYVLYTGLLALSIATVIRFRNRT